MSAKSGKKKGLIIFIIAIVLVGVIGGSVFLGNSKNQTAQSKGSVEQVKKRTIANSISGNGTVESANVEKVKGNSMGLEVETIHVKEGDIVEAGAYCMQSTVTRIGQMIFG